MTAKILKFNKPQLLKPSRPLGKHGQALWLSITSEYGIEDSGGVEMLTLACQALDRAEELGAAIKRDGCVTRTKGIIREHPAIKAELANRSFVVRTLQRLGLDMEALKSVGRPAGDFNYGDNDGD
jgi:hypothetical protein